MDRLYQPSLKGLRPTAKEQREFKLFKLEVESAAIMALKAQAYARSVDNPFVPFKATIGNMECIFYPRDQKAIDKALGQWTTTRW